MEAKSLNVSIFGVPGNLGNRIVAALPARLERPALRGKQAWRLNDRRVRGIDVADADLAGDASPASGYAATAQQL